VHSSCTSRSKSGWVPSPDSCQTPEGGGLPVGDRGIPWVTGRSARSGHDTGAVANDAERARPSRLIWQTDDTMDSCDRGATRCRSRPACRPGRPARSRRAGSRSRRARAALAPGSQQARGRLRHRRAPVSPRAHCGVPAAAVTYRDSAAGHTGRHLIRRPMASVRCIRPLARRSMRCAVQMHPGTVVSGHRDLPAGIHHLRVLTFTESEQSPRAASLRGRADQRDRWVIIATYRPSD
jgi:hypothetical protein